MDVPINSFTVWIEEAVAESILNKTLMNGQFMIRGTNQVHSKDFGTVSGKPSCTCPDRLQWQIPCKYFFFIFKLVEILEWDALPDDFKEKPSFSVDFSAAALNLQRDQLDA